MPLKVDKRETESRITLTGVVEISQAAELKARLEELFEAGQPLLLELEPEAELDITALQLLEAARREARRRGLDFALEGAMPSTVQGLLEEAGLAGQILPEGAEKSPDGVEAGQP